MMDTNRVGDLLSRLGVTPEVLNQPLSQLSKAPLSMLRELRLAYAAGAGASTEANKFGRSINDARVDFPPAGFNPAPKAAFEQLKSTVGKTYYRPTVQRHETSGDIYERLLDPETQRSAKLVRLLDRSAAVRSSFSKIAGAQVVRDGRQDGTITLRNADSGSGSGSSKSGMTASALTSSASPATPVQRPSAVPNNIYSLLNALDQAVLEQAQSLRPNQGSAVELGKGSLIGPELISGGMKAIDGDDSDDDDSDEDSDSTKGVAVRTSQTLQSSQGLTTGGNPVDGYDIAGPTESVDVGTLALQRLMTKRDQMYELVRQVTDKYNQSAKVSIDNMRA